MNSGVLSLECDSLVGFWESVKRLKCDVKFNATCAISTLFYQETPYAVCTAMVFVMSQSGPYGFFSFFKLWILL